jgi:signal peptidase I
MYMSDTINLRGAKKAFKRKWGIWGTLLYIVVLIGIVLGLPRFLSWSLNTQYPMAAITSGSMWPVLKTGDLVFVQGGIIKADLHIGDVVVYRNRVNNTLTIHRVVKLNDDTFVTRGDANFSDDSPASYADIIGKNLTLFGRPLRIPYLGSITIFANDVREAKTP